MNALSVVNRVLRRLRETEVADFSANYTKLILDLVNETKREVEDSWNWTALRTSITVTTSAGTRQYTLAGAGQRYKFLTDASGNVLAFNQTTDNNLYLVGNDYIYRTKNISDPTNQEPDFFAVVGQDSNLDPIIEFVQPCDGTYTLIFYMVIPQDELTATTDTLSVPWHPVVLGSWAKAISERGEDGGQNTIEQQSMYNRSLAEAIAQDEARVGETVWTAV